MDRVVVDTSAWIESFSPRGDEALGQLLRDLILQGRVLLPGIIKTELLRGTRNKKEFDRLGDLLKGLVYLPVPEEFWDRLSEFSFKLFRKGVVVPLADTYIALFCIENNAPILHRDKHFDLIAKESELVVLTESPG